MSKLQQILSRNVFFVCVCVDKSRDMQCNLTTVRFRPALPLSFFLVVTFDESHEMPAWTRNAVMATAIYKIAAESTHGTYGARHGRMESPKERRPRPSFPCHCCRLMSSETGSLSERVIALKQRCFGAFFIDQTSCCCGSSCTAAGVVATCHYGLPDGERWREPIFICLCGLMSFPLLEERTGWQP